MGDLISAIFGAQLSQILVLAGIAFLFVAVAGNISGKIDPGKHGRVASGAIGGVLLIVGLVFAGVQRTAPPPPTPASATPPIAVSAPTSLSGCGQVRCTPVADLPHTDRVRGISFDGSGRRLVSATYLEPQARLWDLSSGAGSPVGSFPLQIGARITSLVGEPLTGIWPCRFTTGRADGSVDLWSIGGDHAGVVDWTAPKRHAREVRALAWDARGEVLASAAWDGVVWLWAPARDPLNPLNDFLMELSPGHGANYALAWRPAAEPNFRATDCTPNTLRTSTSEIEVLGVGAGDGSVLIGNPLESGLEPVGAVHTQAVVSLAWSPDGRRLASGSADGSVALLDPIRRRLLGRQQLPGGAINALAWSEKGLLASGSEDGVVRFLRTEGDQITSVGEIAWNSGPVSALAWSADAVAVGLEKTLRITRVSV